MASYLNPEARVRSWNRGQPDPSGVEFGTGFVTCASWGTALTRGPTGRCLDVPVDRAPRDSSVLVEMGVCAGVAHCEAEGHYTMVHLQRPTVGC